MISITELLMNQLADLESAIQTAEYNQDDESIEELSLKPASIERQLNVAETKQEDDVRNLSYCSFVDACHAFIN